MRKPRGKGKPRLDNFMYFVREVCGDIATVRELAMGTNPISQS